MIGPVRPGEKTIDQAIEEGEVDDVPTTPAASTTSNDTARAGKKKKSRKSKNPGVRNLHKKSDLRKRTWDIVEKDTMDGGVDYGETPIAEPGRATAASKRRMVSYDDV